MKVEIGEEKLKDKIEEKREGGVIIGDGREISRRHIRGEK